MTALAWLLARACLFMCAASQWRLEAQQNCGDNLPDAAVLLQLQANDTLVRKMQVEEKITATNSVATFAENAAAPSAPDSGMLSSPSFASVLTGCECQATFSENDHSHGCCREGGETGWGTSQIFQLQNAIYDSGTLWLLGLGGF